MTKMPVFYSKLESDVEDLGRIGDDYNARMKTAMKSAVLMETEDNFGFDAPSAPLDASDDSEEEDDQDYGEDALVGTPGRFVRNATPTLLFSCRALLSFPAGFRGD